MTKYEMTAALSERKTQTSVGDAEQSRAISEVQSAMVIAKRFPRDPIAAIDRILNACTRPSLAESALYTYSRGGTEITGPSIRLAEAIAQNWGNIEFGIRELEQRDGESTVEAFAWDLETNTKQKKTFQVRHERYTKRGISKLTDPRDIYEMVANQGARRLRACILGVIPGDVTESAQNQCDVTLKANADVTSDSLNKLVNAFAAFKVTRQQIEKRIQRHLDTMLPAQMVSMRKIYNSLKDGMSKPEDWFESDTPKTVTKPNFSTETTPENKKPEGGETSRESEALSGENQAIVEDETSAAKPAPKQISTDRKAAGDDLGWGEYDK